ncbi:hypothetical protein GCM10023205_52730 [Yinghuangia aomiensis]|uniref:Uncharacterized protein n=1 Tax=Yinghuangia aomiensis TaxID=676205 RepID=A0ABP9HU83_9ACTN
MSPYSEDRLPAHDRRRRELLAVLQAEAATPERRSPVIPVAAVAAVLTIAGAGVLVAKPWADGASPAQSGPGVPTAQVGNPVPDDIAAKALASCLKEVRWDPPIDGPPTPMPKPVRPTATSLPVALPAPVWVYKMVFTAWEPDGKGGLNPFVVAVSPKGDSLIGCHGPEAASVPQLAIGPHGEVPVSDSPISHSEYQVPDPRLAGVGPDRPTDSVTLWGYAAPKVVRVDVTDPDGTVRGAVLRGGVWFVNGGHGYGSPGNGPVRIRAYDASGTLLVDAGLGADPAAWSAP